MVIFAREGNYLTVQTSLIQELIVITNLLCILFVYYSVTGVQVLNCTLCAGSVDKLVLHGLRALRDTLPNEVELTTKARSFSFAFLFVFSHGFCHQCLDTVC